MLRYWVRWRQCVWVLSFERRLLNYLCMHVWVCVCVCCALCKCLCVCARCMGRTWLMFASARLRLRRLFLCRQFWARKQGSRQPTKQATTETTHTMKMLLIFLRFQSSQVDLHHCSSFHGCATRHESPPRYLSPLWALDPRRRQSFASLSVSLCCSHSPTVTICGSPNQVSHIYVGQQQQQCRSTWPKTSSPLGTHARVRVVNLALELATLQGQVESSTARSDKPRTCYH